MSDGLVNLISGKLLGVVKGASTALYATVQAIDANVNALDVKVNGALPLPSGAATEAKQDTGNASLASILTKFTDAAARFGVLGVDGSSLASTTNAVPVGGVDTGGTARTALTNAAGVLQSGTAKGTAYSSAALEASAVVSASACLVSQVRAQNFGASTRYLQLHNASSLPANGTVPKAVVAIGTNATGIITFAIPTDRFGTGLVVACSTTQGTLTISGGADFLIAADLFPTNV